MRPHEHFRVFDCACIERRHLRKTSGLEGYRHQCKTHGDSSQQSDSSNQGNTRRDDKCLWGLERKHRLEMECPHTTTAFDCASEYGSITVKNVPSSKGNETVYESLD
jgi:hypothetical protein